ncbi:uncharacterized protein PFL1_00100 [Pseudozyma flocculosa PF-1]|uniref:Uncharacterized protein n=1 Tax=Pseudozyma flocculosa TaxID=84751 RepID=A0A5C3ESG5_9BASI|nr:uncharacterized protein PFL1_00100 [Pseudozyma flocculosa PF-1]EPQ31901.1 hypothetical protein PFL1_00100 [Pseudozyma flocculosa PF-1]SPO35188.1 uncharacterized protein PSFLO_00659 [Pseudozyma flocculosa]
MPLDLTTTNYSFLGVPASLVLAALPHWYTIVLAELNKVQGGWSNVNPRSWVIQLSTKAATGKKLTPLEQTILRGQAAQANSFENAYLFAATIAAGNYAKLPASELNRFVAVWLVTRAIYALLYVKTQSYAKSFVRTLVFQVGIIYIFRIWFLAHKAVNF